MTSPLPLETILPSGQTGYLNPYSGKYTTSRSYAKRMQRGFAAGKSQQTARGKPAQEHIIRRERETGIIGDQFPIGFEARYGFSYAYWNKLKRIAVSEINRRSSPDARIVPYTVTQVIEYWRMGWRDRERPELNTWQLWVEQHLIERLAAMRLYQDMKDARLGRAQFERRSSVPPIEYWWYH